ncbi:hypothetical protein HMPREF9144_1741 [Prevotella pallens ATCC 700821]|uniref:Uncharacterized protein n=1 Tax=Prevotella pallens ATCC 700821 TaxID=997353 RepID=F9DJA1_9BACT|nr:hypothetical protein HMPREF9144_1741 [Prevotella pallens ATCC 700821]
MYKYNNKKQENNGILLQVTRIFSTFAEHNRFTQNTIFIRQW